MSGAAGEREYRQSRNKRRRRARLHNIAGGVVGTVFNVVLIAVAVMLIYRFSILAFQYGVRIFGEPAMSEEPGREVEVTVTDGMDFKGIAAEIYDSGLVRDQNLFLLQEYLSNYAKDGFAAGTYTLSTAMTAEEMMDVMAGSGGEEP